LGRCARPAFAAFAIALIVTLSAGPAHALSVRKIAWDSKPQHNRFTILFDQPAKYNTVDSLADKGFFYLDIYDLDTVYTSRLLEMDDDPSLRYVHAVAYPDHKVLRLVFYVKKRDVSVRVTPTQDPPGLVVDTVQKGAEAPPVPQGAAVGNAATLKPSAEVSVSAPATLPRIPEPRARPTSEPGKRKVVIIDPGHGGANSGATSNDKIGGRIMKEKDLTLQFAYKLKKVIDSSPNMVAHITRPDDRLITLDERVRYAETHLGDLFVSIHMNDGSGNPAARGTEVYYLDEKGTVTGAEKSVEERENKDVGAPEGMARGANPLLKTILTDISRNKLEDFQYESYLVCRRIMESFSQLPGYHQHNRGIKSANFVVLKNFRMPAVLLEVGFITNRDELNYLVNGQFQDTTAVILFNAFNKYFAESDPSFKATRMKLGDGQGT
jgi:N-acetylmuramoyl-L-alanine amidase